MRQGTLLEKLVSQIFRAAGFEVQHSVRLESYEVDVYAKYGAISIIIECKEYESEGLDIPGLIYEWSGKNKKINADKVVLAIYGPEIREKHYALAEEEGLTIWNTEKIQSWLDKLPKAEESLRNMILEDLKLASDGRVLFRKEINVSVKGEVNKEAIPLVKEAGSFFTQGNYHMAVRLIDRALEIEPEHPQLRLLKAAYVYLPLHKRIDKMLSKVDLMLEAHAGQIAKFKDINGIAEISKGRNFFKTVRAMAENMEKSYLTLKLRLEKVANFEERKYKETVNLLDLLLGKEPDFEQAIKLKDDVKDIAENIRKYGALNRRIESLKADLRSINELVETLKNTEINFIDGFKPFCSEREKEIICPWCGKPNSYTIRFPRSRIPCLFCQHEFFFTTYPFLQSSELRIGFDEIDELSKNDADSIELWYFLVDNDNAIIAKQATFPKFLKTAASLLVKEQKYEGVEFKAFEVTSRDESFNPDKGFVDWRLGGLSDSGIWVDIKIVTAETTFMENYKTEPEGFRDIKWKTDISTLRGMVSLNLETGGEIYERREDKLKIGAASIQSILYRFYKGRFYSVVIATEGDYNFEDLKQAIFARFGQVESEKEGKEESWFWLGKMTTVYLSYDQISQEGSLSINLSEIAQQVQLDTEQKVKEDVEKDF